MNKSDYFFADRNIYDISDAGAEVMTAANDLFATGDSVAVSIRNSSRRTTFVNRGGQVDMAGLSALLLPFDPEVSGTQDASITLSDASSVSVGFDSASGGISVAGTSYGSGEHFLLDGKKCTVFDA